MFVSEKLVYIQLQKTGCTHIARLLDKTIGGVQIGKHNPAPPNLIRSDRTFISSIRNPWQWYVSLWSYGCDTNGGFRARVSKKRLPRIREIVNPLKFISDVGHQINKKTADWDRCYGDSNDPKLFREWLRLVYNPEYRFDIGEDYGHTRIYKNAGFYTYRYLKLCCENKQALFNHEFDSYEAMNQFDKKHCYITRWIHTESLESDLINILESVYGNVCDNFRDIIISSKKTNTSSRSKPTSFYYDTETINMVSDMETLLINKFEYKFPESD